MPVVKWCFSNLSNFRIDRKSKACFKYEAQLHTFGYFQRRGWSGLSRDEVCLKSGKLSREELTRQKQMDEEKEEEERDELSPAKVRQSFRRIHTN